MGYWNAEWQALRDKGCICDCLNYDVDNRVDNEQCPYHHPPNLLQNATFHDGVGWIEGLEDIESEDHLVAETIGGTSRSRKQVTMNQSDKMMAEAGIANIGRQLPNVLPSGDMYKPHQYRGSGMPGLIGAPCLLCGGPAGGPIHTVEPEPLPEGQIRVQAIDDKVAGNVIRIEIDNPPTQEARDILMNILPGVLEAWLKKNKDYGDSDDLKSLGARAEFVRMWNKMMKLKASLWEGRKLEGEQPPEIMGDMVAHLLLALNRA